MEVVEAASEQMETKDSVSIDIEETMEVVEAASEQMETKDSVSIDIEERGQNPSETCISMRRKLERLSPLSSDCCIYRVLKQIRQLNKEAYTPCVVSIGPLHHGKEGLQAMEDHKWRYLKDFLGRSTEVSLEDFFQVIKDMETRLRNCYAEPIELGSDEFVKMILVDAAFLIELLLKFSLHELEIYDKPRMIYAMTYDLWLLENQIPFFILEDLFERAKIVMPCSNSNHEVEKLSIIKLTHNLCKQVYKGYIEENLKIFDSSEVVHFVNFLRIGIVGLNQKPEFAHENSTTMAPTVTELRQAGVKFKVRSTSRNLFDVQFNNGILEIPPLKMTGSFEMVIRNQIAFEQCHCTSNLISDYVILIDQLVDAPEDMEFLMQKGILVFGGDCNEGSALINKLGKRIFILAKNFYFSSLCEDLNEYCRVPWHKWKATLKQDYFNTPWTIISVFAAFVLLILSTTQTVFSIIN